MESFHRISGILSATVSALFLAALVSSTPIIDTNLRGKSYFIANNEKASWFEAMAFCTAMGYKLASIEDDAEFETINGLLYAMDLQLELVWIGGSEIGAEDNYYWISTGATVDLNKWDVVEIVDYKDRCMVMFKGKWRHNLCSNAGYFVCESEDISTSTTTTPQPTTTTTPLQSTTTTTTLQSTTTTTTPQPTTTTTRPQPTTTSGKNKRK